MGFLETIDALELDDAEKDRLRREHEAEVAPLRDDTTTLRRENRRTTVEAEVTELSDAGFNDAPSALAFYRAVQLSDDGETGLVLMSDSELNLSGDQAAGTRTSQEMTAAEVLREFVSRIPRTEEGKLKVALSDQASGDEVGDAPASGEELTPEQKTEERRKSAEGWAGRPLKRTRNRYRGGSVPAGGDS